MRNDANNRICGKKPLKNKTGLRYLQMRPKGIFLQAQSRTRKCPENYIGHVKNYVLCRKNYIRHN
mgnify:CR=1 FL=1